jgi:hypothetical protein
MAVAPNFGAVTVDNPPIKLPIGVLTAETITTLLLIFIIVLICIANLNFFYNIKILSMFKLRYI